jgi:putative PIN family toxin of toxin-antitoxin system
LFFENKIQLCISEELMQEYFEVLSRPKFARYSNFVSNGESILVEIGSRAEIYKPKIKLDIISDQDDNKILELADESKADFINTNDNLVLKAPHPSPLSAHRGFFGCKHFSLANEYLKETGGEVIQW